jgi:hypothetical protein
MAGQPGNTAFLFIDAFVDILALRMEGLNYAQFTNKFYDKLRIARDLGGSIEEEIAVAMFLKCLQGSRLNRLCSSWTFRPPATTHRQSKKPLPSREPGELRWRRRKTRKTTPMGPNTS